VFYQIENSVLGDRQVNCERLDHADDHTDVVGNFHRLSFHISDVSCFF